MWSNVYNPIWQINFKISKRKMFYLGLHQVMCWLHFILIMAHFQSHDILFIWIHPGLSNPPIHNTIANLYGYNITLNLHTFSVHNSFPSVLASCCWSLATPIVLGCTPKTLATLWMLDSLTLSVATIDSTPTCLHL
jgi:hypothetical protein